MHSSMQIFSLKAVSIVIEALPFILLGSIISALIQVYVSEDFIRRRTSKNIFKQISGGIFLGAMLPSCECGIVPIVSRMISKGVPAPMAAAYLVSSPVINPIVLVSTYIGFRSSGEMTLMRFLMNIAVAFAVGFLFSVLRNPFRAAQEKTCGCGCRHGHKNNFSEVISHGSSDFFKTLGYLIYGSFFAAAFHVLVPKSLIMSFASSQVLSILAMMIFAILLSVCSEADSFVAAAFVHFSPASLLAFVGIGPIFDLKLMLMLPVLMRKRTMMTYISVSFSVIFILSLIYSQYRGG